MPMTQEFLDAGRSGELREGTMKRVDLRGRRILLANVAGRLCAVDDTCTHEEASLSKGVLKGELVKCPLHNSRFNVCTGEALEDVGVLAKVQSPPAQRRPGSGPVRLR